MPDTAVVAPPASVPSTPQPTIAPSGSPGPAQAGSSMSDAFGQLESRGKDISELSQERPPVSKPKLPSRPRPEEKAPENPVEKAVEKPPQPNENKTTDKPAQVDATDKDKPKTGVETSQPEKPKTGWQRFHEAEKQIKELQSKLEAKEKVATMPEDHPELVRMRSEIEKREKRLAEVENHLRYKDYEASAEYQQNYHKPYLSTAEEATKQATQLKVTSAADGTTRPFTAEEFWKIVHIDDADSAINAAEKLFGEGSAKVNYVIERRNAILLAHQKAETAKSEFRKNAAELVRKQQEDFTRQGQERSAAFRKLMTDGIEKDPALYKPEEGDNEGNMLLQKGFTLVDRVFSGGAPEKEGDPPMSAQEMIAAHAEIRNKAAAFDRVAHKYKTLSARVLELEEALSQYEQSTPAKGEVAAGEKGPAREDDMESILSGLDRSAQ